MADKGDEFSIPEIIKNANILECDGVYANYVQFTIGNNETFLDFYRIEPAKTDSSDNPNAKMVVRIIIPINLSKGIASGLVNAIDKYEKKLKIVLPNQRGKHESDGITIWEEK